MSRALPIADREELDRYYTPDPVARRLVPLLPIARRSVVWEPHAGGGAMVRALAQHPAQPSIMVSDIDPEAWALSQRYPRAVGDFLSLHLEADWIVGNPPYRDAEAHVRHALTRAPNVAFLLRLGFLESASRLPFWQDNPARCVWVLAQRPSFTGGGTDSAAYGWFWWVRGWDGPTELEVLDMEPPRGEQVGLFGGAA